MLSPALALSIQQNTKKLSSFKVLGITPLRLSHQMQRPFCYLIPEISDSAEHSRNRVKHLPSSGEALVEILGCCGQGCKGAPSLSTHQIFFKNLFCSTSAIFLATALHHMMPQQLVHRLQLVVRAYIIGSTVRAQSWPWQFLHLCTSCLLCKSRKNWLPLAIFLPTDPRV